jgi:5'-nucleotidase
MEKTGKFLEILHFNDVYDIEERVKKPKDGSSGAQIFAGAARFVTAMEQHGSKTKLVLFSGDLFNPSTLSTFFKGSQLVEVFNRLNVKVTCLGNHDLDHGIVKM